MRKVFFMLVAPALLFPLAGTDTCAYAKKAGGADMTITLTSIAFVDGGMIPEEYTCDGNDISPPLSWSGVPEGTKSLALICDDPDAPVGTWVHWVLFNIPPTAKGLQRSFPPEKKLDNITRHGINDFGNYGYGGPCPPSGTHRYYFKVYALDIELDEKPGISKAELLKAMDGHILAKGQIMGTYKR